MRLRYLCCCVFVSYLVSLGQARSEEWTISEQPDLASQIAAAKPLDVEALLAPLSTVRFESPITIAAASGIDVLQLYYRGYTGPATAFAIDTVSGEINRFDIPEGRNVHRQGRASGEDGRFYTTLQQAGGGLDLWVYDPGSNIFSSRGSFGESLELMGQVNALTMGADGKFLYGSVGARKENRAVFYRIDTESFAIKILGLGPAIPGSPYVRALHLSSDGKIYTVYGKTPYRLIRFDPITGASEELATAEPLGGFDLLEDPDGSLRVKVTKVQSGFPQDGVYNLSDTDLMKGKSPQLPTGSGEAVDKPHSGGLPAKAKSVKQAYLELVASGVAPAEAKRLAMESTSTSPSFPGQKDPVSSLGGVVVDYETSLLDPALNSDQKGRLTFRVRGESEAQTVVFDAPTYGERISALVALPDGRLFGTSVNRGGHFVYDPEIGEVTFLGRTHLEQNTAAVAGDRIYLSGYPSGLVWSWDYVSNSWDAPALSKKNNEAFGKSDPGDNPRRLGALREFCGIHRATASAVDFRGRVYFGGQWYRDGNGGGFAWWDPKSETGAGAWKPLSSLQVADCAAVNDGQMIVLSTKVVADKVLNKELPASASLQIIDPSADPSVIASSVIPVEGASSTGLIASAGQNRLIGLLPSPENEEEWILYGIDLKSGATHFTKSIPAFVSGKASGAEILHSYRMQFSVAPDRSIWMNRGGTILRINPSDAHVEVVGRLAKTRTASHEATGRIVFQKGAIYMSGSTSLLKINL